MTSTHETDLRQAVEDVLLGASIKTLHREYQMRRLAVDEDDEWIDALRRLSREERARLHSEALGFVGDVCRRLGERHSNDTRIRTVLEDWVRESKDYAAFDALLAHFDFPHRAQLLAEACRLFPSTLTAHW